MPPSLNSITGGIISTQLKTYYSPLQFHRLYTILNATSIYRRRISHVLSHL